MAKTPTANRVKSDRPRHARDFYETPYGLCHAYIHRFVSAFEDVLDPGAGNGVWGKAFEDVYNHSYIMGLDLSEVWGEYTRLYYDEWHTNTDYLGDIPITRQPEIIIGNPPYSLAEPFVRRSLDIVADYGQVHFLLPLAFLGSIKRRDGLFAEHPPEFVTISSRRPSFFSTNGKHTTDALEYAIFQWNKTKSSPVYPSIRWFDWSYE